MKGFPVFPCIYVSVRNIFAGYGRKTNKTSKQELPRNTERLQYGTNSCHNWAILNQEKDVFTCGKASYSTSTGLPVLQAYVGIRRHTSFKGLYQLSIVNIVPLNYFWRAFHPLNCSKTDIPCYVPIVGTCTVLYCIVVMPVSQEQL